MSRRQYPRLDSVKRLREREQKKCGATGCTERATKWVSIQFTYMRGEDEGVYSCDKHADGCNTRTSEFCGRFPPEAWK